DRVPEDMFGNPNGSSVVVNLTYEVPFQVTQSFIIMLFYGISSLFLLLETTRLSNNIHFFLNHTIQRTLRKEELDTIAAYVYMPVGYLFIALTCPETVIIGVFCLSAFADSAAAIVGIKFGKHKIDINPKKSWEGLIGGFATAAVTTSLFVGPIWGISAALLFAVLDLLTPTIIKINDNISVPVFTVLLFFLFNILNINAVCYLPITPFC
ncbi:MAG: hypothetical protein GF364_16625, partial [Candidatus Lokiarchaeota archaeon]|nr:hypothetical protein [Candidatus Lokiarchaeota archaeon]